MKSFIYDVDGTLWDSTENVASTWRDVCSRHGIPADHITADRLLHEFGKLLPDIGRSVFPDIPEEKMLPILEECCVRENEDLLAARQPLYDDTLETLRTLHERGFRQIIVSNCQSGYIEVLIQIHHLEPYIDGHLCAGDTGRGKAENIIEACKRWNLTDPCYVGDTAGDRESARTAGVPFVHAAYGFGEVSDADYAIRALRDLLTLF